MSTPVPLHAEDALTLRIEQLENRLGLVRAHAHQIIQLIQIYDAGEIDLSGALAVIEAIIDKAQAIIRLADRLGQKP